MVVMFSASARDIDGIDHDSATSTTPSRSNRMSLPDQCESGTDR